MRKIGIFGKLVSKKMLKEDAEIKEYNSMIELLKAYQCGEIELIIAGDGVIDDSIELVECGKRIPVDNIKKIYKSDRVSIIETEVGEECIVYKSLNQIEEILKDNIMIRINQSEIYPIRKIKRIVKGYVELEDGDKRKLGRRYAKDVKECLMIREM